jgi:uncharacterized protein (DUF2252 family)
MFYEVPSVPAPAGRPVKAIIGDRHIENSAHSSDPEGFHKNREPDAVFDVNDFDDCTIGPWRFDLPR